jgi:hypothetical protein
MVTSPFVCYLTDDSLHSTARAYYLSSFQDPENLTRAEAALQELITTTENQVSGFTFWGSTDLNFVNWGS